MAEKRSKREEPQKLSKFRFAVSFESDTRPVHTVRGEFDKVDAETALKSAVFSAFKTPPRGNYRSWVVCVEQLEGVVDVEDEGQTT